MKSDLTLVTMYYDLKKYEKRTQHYYLTLPSITYDLDINIIFFTESDFHDTIWKERKKRNLLHKTLIIIKEFNELEYMADKNLLEKNFSNMPDYIRTNKDSINYMILVWNKIFFLEKGIKMNPFDTNYFGWIDFGLEFRIRRFKPSQVENIFDKITKKIKICETSNCGLSDLENYNFCDVKAHRTAGGIFTGNSYYLSLLIQYFKETLTDIINNNKLSLEESIIWIILKKHPEIFKPYYGWYDTLLINYDTYKCGKGQIINVIYLYFMQKKYVEVVKICEEILLSDLRFISYQNLFDLFDMYSISAYYLNVNYGKNVFMKFFKIISLNPKLIPIFENNITRLYNNILNFSDASLLISEFNKILKCTQFPNLVDNSFTHKEMIHPAIEHISDLSYNDQYKT